MARHARLSFYAAAVVFSFASALLGVPRPKLTLAVPPPTEPAATQPTSRPSWPPIPRETLLGMYKSELAEKYRADQTDLYTRAHGLIEQYFETPKAAERKQIAKQIESCDLDPAVIGRLCRLRMYWPDLDGGGVYYINEKVGVHPTRYFFGVPKTYDRTKAWPLVIKLPTVDAFLTEPPPTADEVVRIYVKWMKEELTAHPDAAVVMPLLNLDELWGPSYPGMAAVMQPFQHVASRVNIDPARVYMVGHAMSAHAVWNLALLYPTYFAAINPLAGGASEDWQRIRVSNLRNVLPVVWHDAQDDLIKVDVSRGIVKAMRLQKIDVDYEETKGIGHVPDAATAERAYLKLRARTRNLYPPTVTLRSNRPDTAFNRNDWVQVYQLATSGKDHHAVFRHGSGSMTYTENDGRIDATIKGNRIDVTTSNIDSFRLYLNDKMLDIRKPITLMVNARPRLEALVPQSVEEMMKDQAFLGRGWRYYSAVLDVEMSPRPPTSRPTTRPATRPATRP